MRLLAHSWRHLDLFSGIGGFALACRMVGGIETVGFCEREPYAQKVLKKHWPDVPICNDIHEMKGNEYGTIDIITGGFPCQPYSKAGKQMGAGDDRHLWPQMLRVIRESKPCWVLGENVANLIKMGLDEVLSDLEEAGYSAEAVCLPACSVGAPHKRERLWVVAHSYRGGRNENRQAGRLGGIPQYRKDVPSTLAPSSSASRWQGGETKLGIPRVADGVSGRVDGNCALGNAIVPQVAAEIIAAMKRVDIVANKEVSIER